MPPIRSSEPSMTPWSSPSTVREHHERELLDLLVELLIGHRQPGSVEELTELIELGGLERDGISGLDVHRQSIVAEPHP